MKAQEANTQIHLLSIFYGQGAEISEKEQSVLVANWLKEKYSNIVEHFILTIGGQCKWHKQKELDKANLALQGFVGWRTPSGGWEKSGYPSTRDEVFSLVAAAGVEARLAETDDATQGEIILATTGEDLDNFEDIEPVVYETHLNQVLAKKIMPRRGRPMKIVLPLIKMKKSEVIKRGTEIDAPLHLTWSCYFGEPGKPCGDCDQCRWRATAFAEANVKDPTI